MRFKFFFKCCFQVFFKHVFLLLIKTFYSVEIKGRENIPSSGSVILAGNHISYIDGFFIVSHVKRPVKFIVDWIYYKKPGFKQFFDMFEAIPIAPQKYDPKILEQAYKNAVNKMNEGAVICIFPEGYVSKDGDIGKFYKGIERLLDRKWVPVVPFSISGLWGSIFSWKDGKIIFKIPRQVRRKVIIEFGRLLEDKPMTVDVIKEEVCLLKNKNDLRLQ